MFIIKLVMFVETKKKKLKKTIKWGEFANLKMIKKW